ncbi:hypothetical protein BDV34DRAFT_195306 [Aspergillus parasiticus]|uniref:LITAF domain-containing protein n=1 Tax=Aspergillus parasiticus TaxID=5067 RepID=A0A5N6DKL0_ASPPA|nr:hypothetical protein BDV34DRAFT_195306 [Aspergillus parasiticus]
MVEVVTLIPYLQDSVDTSHEHSEAEHASGDRGTTFTSNDEQSQDSRPTVSLEQLRSISERVFCPVCKITAYTDIQETEPCTEIDTWILYSTWVGICLWSLYLSSHSVWAFLLFILSIFSVKRCLFVSHKNVEHRCGNCQTLLAVWERGEYIVLQELPGVE